MEQRLADINCTQKYAMFLMVMAACHLGCNGGPYGLRNITKCPCDTKSFYKNVGSSLKIKAQRKKLDKLNLKNIPFHSLKS